MKKDLPNIYKNKNATAKKNNRSVCYVTDDYKVEREKIDNSGTVTEKLKKLFRSSRYVFNIGVVIETEHNTYDTKIAGQVKNSIVTVDGEVIPIIEIKNITIKDRL